ncbi:type II toxin-antitoxin system RelE/ParE family toxin [Streptomyces griseoruber]|uniref:type II toxin-antitoxin system RelE/ParE family toxin n=1 Tax=Streptomyces griseoruber TaxID=1943 RepID=UPI003792D261
MATLLVSPQVIEDLEDALAVADHQRRKAEGTHERGRPVRRLRVRDHRALYVIGDEVIHILVTHPGRTS